MNKKLVLALVAAGTMYVLTACNDGTTTTEKKDSATAAINTDTGTAAPTTDTGMMGPVNTMTEKIKAMHLSGDFDQDFANVMIVNHQGALDVSKMAVPKLVEPEIKAMAQRMVTDHTAEIENLKKFLAGHDTTSADHKKPDDANHTHADGAHHELSDDLSALTAKMMSMSPTGNADKDYVMLMLAHHENAIRLSEDEIAHGHHTELKNMAKAMEEDDKKEVAGFKKWLATVK